MVQIPDDEQDIVLIKEEDLELSPFSEYRNGRIEQHVRRTLSERAAASTGYPPERTPKDNLRRAAVLRETSLESALEFVDYPMPETVPQEHARSLEIDRDMKDAGIYSAGIKAEEILHIPPRHARLRSSRDIILGQDIRVTAARVDVQSWARPYVPQGIVDADGESRYPYQHHNKHGRGRTERSNLIADQNADFRRESRILQGKLGINNSMGLDDISAVASDIKYAMNMHTTGSPSARNTIVSALRELHQNWVPTAEDLQKTGFGTTMNRLRRFSDVFVAKAAEEIYSDWREATRTARDRTPVQTTVVQDTEDPFMDADANLHLFGQTIRRDVLASQVVRRRQAGLEHNRSVAEAIRQRERELNREVIRRRGGNSSLPNANGAGPNAGQDPVQTGNDHEFKILEVDPSPERGHSQTPDQNNYAPRGILVTSVEAGQNVGSCHACPDFPGTFHHVCAPENRQCVNLLNNGSQENAPPRSPQRPQTPQHPQQTNAERVQIIQAALAALAANNRQGAFHNVRPMDPNTLLNDSNNSHRTSPPGSRSKAAEPIRTQPQVNPPHIPEGMADPFTSSSQRTPSVILGDYSVRGGDRFAQATKRRRARRRASTSSKSPAARRRADLEKTT